MSSICSYLPEGETALALIPDDTEMSGGSMSSDPPLGRPYYSLKSLKYMRTVAWWTGHLYSYALCADQKEIPSEWCRLTLSLTAVHRLLSWARRLRMVINKSAPLALRGHVPTLFWLSQCDLKSKVWNTYLEPEFTSVLPSDNNWLFP